MKEPIKKGDLVYVAYGFVCCKANPYFGHTFSVTKTENRESHWRCGNCGASGTKPNAHLVYGHSDGVNFHDNSLKVIPPLSELEKTENYEVMTK